MPRQKLPDGWSIVLGCECGWQSRSMPAPVALAIIRNAGADAVYEAAKRLVKDDPLSFAENFGALRALIESLEET